MYDVVENGTTRIEAAPVKGTGWTVLTTGPGFAGDATFSPDDSRIAYAHRADTPVEECASPQIWVMDADGANPRPLIEPGDTGGGWEPSYSPDGTLLTFVRERTVAAATLSSIMVADADGTGVRIVAGPVDYAAHPRFSPDGDTIVYGVQASGGAGWDERRNGIWTVPAAGVDPTHPRRPTARC